MRELEVALAVAQRRSFRGAAAALGMSPTAVSAAVAALERELGARLFNRTTRAVSLTRAGERLVAETGPAMRAIRDAFARVHDTRAEVAGELRINTSMAGARQLTGPIAAFLRRYPATSVDMVTDSRFVDIVEGGFDAGVRTRERVPRDMVAVPIGGSLAFAIVGAPAYLRAHGTPAQPDELARHRCIRIGRGEQRYRWELERGRRSLHLDVPGPLTMDRPELMLDAARAGIGLAYLPRWLVDADLERKRLVQVLAGWTPETPGLCLYYPVGRHPPAALRAFVDLLKA